MKIRNLYKQMNVFRCTHENHSGFSGKMSAYHVLKKRNCFPEGCLYFKWRCKQLNKRHKCHRGFSHVGKQCFSCRYFYEEKIHLRPELQLPEDEFEVFMKSFEQFEEWVYFHQKKEHEISGTIDNIKPFYQKVIHPKGESVRFKGFLLTFKELYCNLDHIEDRVYIRISSKTQDIFHFRSGDKILGRATLNIKDGRFIFNRLHHVEIESRGQGTSWSRSEALVAASQATVFHSQPEGCMECPFGALVDVEYEGKTGTRSRELFCLKGIQDFRMCHVKAEFCYFNNGRKL